MSQVGEDRNTTSHTPWGLVHRVVHHGACRSFCLDQTNRIDLEREFEEEAFPPSSQAYLGLYVKVSEIAL